MKKLMLVLSFITGSILMANAQMAQKSPEQRAKHMTKRLQKKLALSQDQAKQIDAIFITQATRMDSLNAHRSADKKENRLAARSIMLSSEKNIAAVLNGAQQQQFMDLLKARKEKHKERMETPGTK